LGAGRRVLVDSPQESRRKRWIVHAIFECTLLRNLAQIAKVGSGSLSGNAVHPEFRRDRLRLIQLKANCKLNEDRNRLFDRKQWVYLQVETTEIDNCIVPVPVTSITLLERLTTPFSNFPVVPKTINRESSVSAIESMTSRFMDRSGMRSWPESFGEALGQSP
jgi:hypothetical protein